MPFKSKAQQSACYASGGFNGKVDCEEWSDKTDQKSLPKKKKEKSAGLDALIAEVEALTKSAAPPVFSPEQYLNLESGGIPPAKARYLKQTPLSKFDTSYPDKLKMQEILDNYNRRKQQSDVVGGILGKVQAAKEKLKGVALSPLNEAGKQLKSLQAKSLQDKANDQARLSALEKRFGKRPPLQARGSDPSFNGQKWVRSLQDRVAALEAAKKSLFKPDVLGSTGNVVTRGVGPAQAEHSLLNNPYSKGEGAKAHRAVLSRDILAGLDRLKKIPGQVSEQISAPIRQGFDALVNPPSVKDPAGTTPYPGYVNPALANHSVAGGLLARLREGIANQIKQRGGQNPFQTESSSPPPEGGSWLPWLLGGGLALGGGYGLYKYLNRKKDEDNEEEEPQSRKAAEAFLRS